VIGHLIFGAGRRTPGKMDDNAYHKRALLVFSRLPRKGLVKSRLAVHIGTQMAFDCFLMLSGRCLETASVVCSARFLYLYPGHWTSGNLDLLQPVLPYFRLRTQRPGDLGGKMASAFCDMFSHGYSRAVIIGADIPFITAQIIERAFFLLETRDVVLGPAFDGGYYLIGIRTESKGWPVLFKKVRWGTSMVLEDTLKNAAETGLNPALLEPLFDVDTRDDLERWREEEKDADIRALLDKILNRQHL
jgi:rSAM/selenodomain-associated transferase 1